MLDLDAIRAEFAAHLAANSGQRWRLDASVAHVVEIAYRKGLEDARTEIAANRPPIITHAGEAGRKDTEA